MQFLLAHAPYIHTCRTKIPEEVRGGSGDGDGG
jgi:hypothetical protein